MPDTMDIHELGKDLQFIGSQLQTIRNLSKGNAIDYSVAPYDNDMRLLEHLLDANINSGLDAYNKQKQEEATPPCPHIEVTTAFATEKPIKTSGCEKDFLVSCSECNEELYRLSAYGRHIVSLIPTY